MPLDVIFRGPGVWGAGKGSRLTALEADTDLYNLKIAIEDLQANPTQPNEITSITVTSTTMTFHFQDGGTIGPLPLPVLQFRWRGNWLPDTVYLAFDAFAVADVGIFVVALDHTSVGVGSPAVTFDPDAVGDPVTAGSFLPGATYLILDVGTTDFTLIGAASNTVGLEFIATGVGTGTGTALPKLYLQLIGVTANTTLDGLADVTITAPADGDVFVYDAALAQWVNKPTLPIGDLPAAQLPLDHANTLIELSEPTGSPGSPDAYDSVQAVLSDLFGPGAVWAGGVIAGQYGGTGVANTGKTITLGGSLQTIGAFDTILRASAATDVTLPTTGTLATLAGTETLSNKTLSSGAKVGTPDVTAGTLNVSGFVSIVMTHVSATATAGPSLIAYRARGSVGSPTAVLSGDRLGQISSRGYDGAAYSSSSAGITFDTSENWSGSAHGTYISFFGTPAGGTTTTGMLTIFNSSLIVGSAAIATTATDGFLYIASGAGPPTGVPTTFTGRVPLYYDSTNDQLYIYRGGWKQPKTPAGAAIVNWQ